MKSRAEGFVGNDKKQVDNIRDDIKDLRGDVRSNTRDVKSASETIQSVANSASSNIKNLQDKKLNINDFEKTLSNDVKFNEKLSASDFDATLSKNAKFRGKLNENDFDATLEKNAKFNGKLNTSDFETTLGKSDLFKTKLNTSEFSSTLSKDPAILKLQTDLKGVPTSDNIGTVVNQQVQAKMGDINAANATLTTNFKDYAQTLNTRAVEFNKLIDDRGTDFNKGVAARMTEFNDNAEDKLGAYNRNASMKKNEYEQTATTQLDLLNSNYQSKIGELSSLKSGAETARDQAVGAKDAAEEAKYKTQKMYDDVFKEASSRVVTQANKYRDGLNKNQTTGFYEPFGTIYEALENPVQQDVFDKEKDVIQDINDLNTKYYNFIICLTSNGTKCGTPNNPVNTAFDYLNAFFKLYGATQAEIDNIKQNLDTTLTNEQKNDIKNYNFNVQKGSLNELSDLYSNLKTETDQTEDIKKRAKAIDELRRDLDLKMDAILKSKSRIDEPSITYDSTVYAGILWSILGTSLLFYVFTE
jgi:hypothetical protein